MQQKDFLKIEVWLDGKFYNKYDVDPKGYNLIAMLRDFKQQVAEGKIPSANKIEIRKGL
jgi:hypothetical protein